MDHPDTTPDRRLTGRGPIRAPGLPPSPKARAPRGHAWLKAGLLASGLLIAALQPGLAQEDGAEPLEEVEAFTAAGAVGTLVLPPGAPDRRTPAIVILQGGVAPDGRASHYMDQLLGAGFAVLEVVHWSGEGLGAALEALARHPRVLADRLGLLGFGLGARQAAALPAPVAARALLYPGCEGLSPASMAGEPVLLMHGDADPANPARACASLGQALAQAGAEVRQRVLPGATYAWDRPAFVGEGQALLPRPDAADRVTSEAWPEMAMLSAAEVAGFFATNLLRTRP